MSERKNTSLNELMGSAGSKAKSRKLGLDDLKEILGERCPKIEFNPVGRMRLSAALRVRFGDNWKHLPGIEGIMKKFDDEAKFAVRLQELKQIKGKKA